jgi:hypothetical protein
LSRCEHDPQVLAAKKHHRVKRSEAEIVAALNGDYRKEHLFVLQQELHREHLSFVISIGSIGVSGR